MKLAVLAVLMPLTADAQPGTIEARGYYYTDNSGLTVVTTAAALEQRVARHTTVVARAVADHIAVQRRTLDPGDPGALAQFSGHHDADVVTSASAVVGGGGVAEKWRFEGLGGVVLDGEVAGEPASLRLTGRGSTEPDYASLSAQLLGTLELFDRNTTVSAFVGAGNDWIDPIEKPPGHQDEWPAQHHRVTAGASVAQLLSPRLVLQAGGGMTLQQGMLESPYRRALVLAPGGRSGTLFPEQLPHDRRRYTAFLGISWYVRRGLGVHVQQGAYLDSWDVKALIPEVLIAQSFASRRGLALVRYRFYSQDHARFHESHYHTLDVPYMSGDPRLSDLEDHTAGAEVRWNVAGPFTLAAGYELSVLSVFEEDTTTSIVAHIPMISASASY